MPKIIERLKNQLAARGEKNPERMAYAIGNKEGLVKGRELTPKGKARQVLGAAGRAKDRAAKAGGGKASDYAYNKNTNRATKR